MFMGYDIAKHWKFQRGLIILLLTSVTAQRLRFAASPPEEDETINLKVACALCFTRSPLVDSAQITLLGHAPWIDHFLRVNRIPVTLLQLGDEPIPVHNQRTDVVFIVTDGEGNRSFVERALANVRRQGVFLARVMVWWRSGDPQAAVDAAWDLEVVRLVVVSDSDGSQQIHRYGEKCEQGSIAARAALVGQCGPKGLLPTGGDFFPDLQRWNLQGCPLRMGVTSTAPFVNLYKSADGRFALTGMFAPLPWILAKLINATLDFKPYTPTLTYGSVGEFGDIKYKDLDIIFGYFLRLAVRDKLLTMSPSNSMECFLFSVPSGLGTKASPWHLVYREFSPVVWALFTAAYFLIVVLFSMPWEDEALNRVHDAVFYSLSAVFGNSFVIPKFILRVRILAMFWLMFCIVLTTAYQSKRHSLVAAPPEPPEMNSLQQLLQSGLVVHGVHAPNRELRRIAREQDNATLLGLCDRLKTVKNLSDAVHRMATKRDVAVFNAPSTFVLLAHPMERARGRKLVHSIPKYCAFTVHMSHFVLQRGSRLSLAVIHGMTRALDAGLFEHCFSRLMSPRPEAQQELSQLDLAKLSASFQMLLIGLAISAIVLIIEILMHQPRVALSP